MLHIAKAKMEITYVRDHEYKYNGENGKAGKPSKPGGKRGVTLLTFRVLLEFCVLDVRAGGLDFSLGLWLGTWNWHLKLDLKRSASDGSETLDV